MIAYLSKARKQSLACPVGTVSNHLLHADSRIFYSSISFQLLGGRWDALIQPSPQHFFLPIVYSLFHMVFIKYSSN